MFDILKYIYSFKKYQDIVDDICLNKNIFLKNTTANISKMLAILSFNKLNKNVVYICENTYEASKTYEIMSNLIGDKAMFYPVEEFISADLVASSLTFKIARMMTLNAIARGEKGIIITTPEGFTKNVMSKDKISNSVLEIKSGDIYPIKNLCKDLFNRGYKKASTCSEPGTFSVRGYVIDIYPINNESMYRLYFFDDEIESIKIVDINTQRSIKSIDLFNIYPLYDIYYEEDDIENIIDRIKYKRNITEKVEKDIYRIKNHEELDQMGLYLPFIDPNCLDLISYLGEAICIFEDIDSIFKHERETISNINDYLKNLEFNLDYIYFNNIRDLLNKSFKNIYTSNSISLVHDIKLDSLLDLNTLNIFDYNNNLRNLIQDLSLNKGSTYIITHVDDNKLMFLKEMLTNNNVLFNENSIVEGEINLVTSSNAIGFIDEELKLVVITPNEFAASKINNVSKYQKYYKQASKIYTKEDVRPGDYVIHQTYGIGRYIGIEQRELRGKINDYLSVEYKDSQKLLIPVENIYLLEKYNVVEGTRPKLNNLSGKEWNKKKEKIKEELYDVAKRLIKVQEERKLRQGYIYDKDNELQEEFESDFPYNETDDQLKAINEVKADMESPNPVDRLICGDVGFGKTEVAMRAAFKAVMSGKQVIYLAPTTVLSRQHYYSFKERFEKYGVKIALVNRFVQPAMQKNIISSLATGYIDIVIGTHRLLSSDFKYKNLGLLIIDEEQRFGVMHKEQIKMLKADIDVLTLTATPIPRTLQMSINGLKDISIINTPPVNRLPVQTYVLEHNDSVIKEAINREISRGGQIFYLLNRIEELDKVEKNIYKLCPNIKIGVIHGRLDKEIIEDELVKFLDKTYDLLLCTTIIETGIDIPNANTLIIDRADVLGLSQLYQIRGRVGRSDRISYAYLMYNQGNIVSDDAKKRLSAIKEFTALGSGYQIAMRDLAIRGAGDILGEKQSGFIDSVGLQVYNNLLNEVISELKGIKVEKQVDEKRYRIDISKHIDDIYIPDEDIRILAHKEINTIHTLDELKKIKAEFIDRFGRIPNDVEIYMHERYLNSLLKKAGVDIYKDLDTNVEIIFDRDTTSKMNFKELSKLAQVICPEFEFGYKNYCLNIYIKKDKECLYINKLIKFIEKMLLC